MIHSSCISYQRKQRERSQMTYTHLTTDELVLIESYYYQNKKIIFVAKQLKRSRQTIYNVYNALNDGLSILDYYQRYKTNKKKLR